MNVKHQLLRICQSLLIGVALKDCNESQKHVSWVKTHGWVTVE